MKPNFHKPNENNWNSNFSRPLITKILKIKSFSEGINKPYFHREYPTKVTHKKLNSSIRHGKNTLLISKRASQSQLIKQRHVSCLSLKPSKSLKPLKIDTKIPSSSNNNPLIDHQTILKHRLLNLFI